MGEGMWFYGGLEVCLVVVDGEGVVVWCCDCDCDVVYGDVVYCCVCYGDGGVVVGE